MNDRADAPKRWEDVPQSAYLPAERLRAMDTDGVAYSVLYPTFAGFSGENIWRFTDSDLELACVQAYNDWLIEEWADCSDRFIPQCIVAAFGPVEARLRRSNAPLARTQRRCVSCGADASARCPRISIAPEYDPIWATCQDLDVPLCFHAGSSRQLQFPVAPTLSPELAAAMQAVTRTASAVFDLVNLLFSRILLRFPSFKVVFAESTIGWGTFHLGIRRSSIRAGPLRL